MAIRIVHLRDNSLSYQPKILIADDDRSIRLMLETGLTLNGFRVTTARTGREAVDAASTGEYDAILSDVYMPEAAWNWSIALRSTDPKMPIVLMTAQGSLQIAVEAVARGASRFYRQAIRHFCAGSAAAALSRRAPRSRLRGRNRGSGRGTSPVPAWLDEAAPWCWSTGSSHRPLVPMSTC